MFLTISMKLKISTYRVLSEKKARSCNNPTNSLFVMSISVCAHCHFLAGDGNVQQWEQPFIFGGLSFCWTVSEKNVLHFRTELSLFTTNVYVRCILSCLALSRREMRYQNAVWLNSAAFLLLQLHKRTVLTTLLPFRSLSKMQWRLNRLGSLFNFQSDISISAAVIKKK